jgi:putative ABC transport system ATP-binding protein
MQDDSHRVIVDLKGVAKHYGAGEARVDALRNLDLTVHAGEVAALLGPSGSGKTTLLNIIGCTIDPSEGQVSLDGEMVYGNLWLRGDLRKLRLDKIGFIFQAHNLLPFLNATDNVALVLQLAGKSRAQAQARAQELLDYLEVGHRARAMPALLSGGDCPRAGQQPAHHSGG